MDKILPKNWVEANISSFITDNGIFVDGDWIESKDQDPNGDVRIIQLADIGINEFRNRSDRFLTLESAENLKCTFLKQNDILIARMPDPIGRACLFPLKGQYVTVVDIAIVRLDKKYFNTKLFAYYLNSPVINKKSLELASGSTRQRISRKNLDTIKIPLPPLAEQERIANKLNNLFKSIDLIKERMEKIPMLLKDFRQQLLTQAVTGKLTEEWRDGKGIGEWETKSFSEMGKLISGFAFKSTDFVNEGIQLVRMGNLYNNELNLKRSPVYLPFNYDNKIVERYSTKKGDVLLSLTGTKYKRDYGFAIEVNVEDRLLINQRILCIRPVISNKYLVYILRDELFRDQFFSFETGGVNQGNVGVKNLITIKIKVPKNEEQNEIVSRVESLFAKADAIENQYNKLKEKVDVLPQALLHKAFKGELVEQLPTDGDAADLLKEILALKKELVKKSKKK